MQNKQNYLIIEFIYCVSCYQLYYALEDSDCCERTCSGSSRSFNMKFHDNFNNEVITLFREFACTGGCCPYSAQQLEVYSPPGHLIGIIGGEGGFFSPKFTIMSSNGEPLLRIEGPASRLISADFNVIYMNSLATLEILIQISFVDL